jgi:hypothetical protein
MKVCPDRFKRNHTCEVCEMTKLTAEQKLLKILEKADVNPSKCEFPWCGQYPYGLCYCCLLKKRRKEIGEKLFPLSVVSICVGLSVGMIIGFMIGRH